LHYLCCCLLFTHRAAACATTTFPHCTALRLPAVHPHSFCLTRCRTALPPAAGSAGHLFFLPGCCWVPPAWVHLRYLPAPRAWVATACWVLPPAYSGASATCAPHALQTLGRRCYHCTAHSPPHWVLFCLPACLLFLRATAGHHLGSAAATGPSARHHCCFTAHAGGVCRLSSGSGIHLGAAVSLPPLLFPSSCCLGSGTHTSFATFHTSLCSYCTALHHTTTASRFTHFSPLHHCLHVTPASLPSCIFFSTHCTAAGTAPPAWALPLFTGMPHLHWVPATAILPALGWMPAGLPPPLHYFLFCTTLPGFMHFHLPHYWDYIFCHLHSFSSVHTAPAVCLPAPAILWDALPALSLPASCHCCYHSGLRQVYHFCRCLQIHLFPATGVHSGYTWVSGRWDFCWDHLGPLHSFSLWVTMIWVLPHLHCYCLDFPHFPAISGTGPGTCHFLLHSWPPWRFHTYHSAACWRTFCTSGYHTPAPPATATLPGTLSFLHCLWVLGFHSATRFTVSSPATGMPGFPACWVLRQVCLWSTCLPGGWACLEGACLPPPWEQDSLGADFWVFSSCRVLGTPFRRSPAAACCHRACLPLGFLPTALYHHLGFSLGTNYRFLPLHHAFTCQHQHLPFLLQPGFRYRWVTAGRSACLGSAAATATWVPFWSSPPAAWIACCLGSIPFLPAPTWVVTVYLGLPPPPLHHLCSAATCLLPCPAPPACHTACLPASPFCACLFCRRRCRLPLCLTPAVCLPAPACLRLP